MPEAPAQEGDDLGYIASNTNYLKIEKKFSEINHILKKRCFSCHQSTSKKPWYTSIPRFDLWYMRMKNNAISKLDFFGGFPFLSPRSFKGDLILMENALLGEEMPPTWYQVIHFNGRLRSVEREKILDYLRYVRLVVFGSGRI